MKFGGICITTDNLLRLVEFYKVVFDMQPFIEGEHYSFGPVAIYNPSKETPKRDKSIWLQCFTNDIDKEYSRLVESIPDIVTVSPPERRPWGAYSFWFEDPDGNRIAVAQINS